VPNPRPGRRPFERYDRTPIRYPRYYRSPTRDYLWRTRSGLNIYRDLYFSRRGRSIYCRRGYYDHVGWRFRLRHDRLFYYRWRPYPPCPTWRSWLCPRPVIWTPPFYFYEPCYDLPVYRRYIVDLFDQPAGISPDQYKDIILERLTHTDELIEAGAALEPELAWDAVEGAEEFGPNKVALLLMVLNSDELLQGEDVNDLWLKICELPEPTEQEAQEYMQQIKDEVELRRRGESALFDADNSPTTSSSPFGNPFGPERPPAIDWDGI
jgi:hypothetical protein